MIRGPLREVAQMDKQGCDSIHFLQDGSALQLERTSCDHGEHAKLLRRCKEICGILSGVIRGMLVRTTGIRRESIVLC